MMELYAIDVFVDLLRRYGNAPCKDNASPMDEYASLTSGLCGYASRRPLTIIYGGIN